MFFNIFNWKIAKKLYKKCNNKKNDFFTNLHKKWFFSILNIFNSKKCLFIILYNYIM